MCVFNCSTNIRINFDFVFFHLAAGRIGLLAACSLFIGSPHGLGRPVWPVIHSIAFEFCLRDSRHHGHSHHCQCARPMGHHFDCPIDDLLSQVARLYLAHLGLGLVLVLGRSE